MIVIGISASVFRTIRHRRSRRVDGKDVRLTNLDKPFWPSSASPRAI